MAAEVSNSYCGWPHEEISSRNESQHMSASKLRGVGSASFGRYEVESVLWEKRSVFTVDRRKEELETCRLHGLVTKKRAFFEEYYKGFRAAKALQVNQQTLDCRNNDTSSQSSEADETAAASKSSEADETVAASKSIKDNQKTENAWEYGCQIASTSGEGDQTSANVLQDNQQTRQSLDYANVVPSSQLSEADETAAASKSIKDNQRTENALDNRCQITSTYGEEDETSAKALQDNPQTGQTLDYGNKNIVPSSQSSEADETAATSKAMKDNQKTENALDYGCQFISTSGEEDKKSAKAMQDNQQTRQTLDYRKIVASSQSSEADETAAASKAIKDNQKTENALDYGCQFVSTSGQEDKISAKTLQVKKQTGLTLDYRKTVASSQSSEADETSAASKAIKDNQKTENDLDYRCQIASTSGDEEETSAKLETFVHEGPNYKPTEVALDNVVQNGKAVQNISSDMQSPFSLSSQYIEEDETSAGLESTEKEGNNSNNFNMPEGTAKLAKSNVVENGKSVQIANMDIQTSFSPSRINVKESKYGICPHNALHMKEDIKVIIHETVITSANKGISATKISSLFHGEPVEADQVSGKSSDSVEPNNKKDMQCNNDISYNPLESPKIVSVTKMKDSASFVRSTSLDQKKKMKYKSSTIMGTFQKSIGKKELITQQSKKAADKLAKKDVTALVAMCREVTASVAPRGDATESRSKVTIPCPFSFATEQRANKISSACSDGKSEVVPKSASRISLSQTHAKNVAYVKMKEKKTTLTTSPKEDKRSQKIRSAASESAGGNLGIKGSNSIMVGSLKSRLVGVTQPNKFKLREKDKTSRDAAKERKGKEVMTSVIPEPEKADRHSPILVACRQTGNATENKKKAVHTPIRATLLTGKKAHCSNLSSNERNNSPGRQEKPRWR